MHTEKNLSCFMAFMAFGFAAAFFTFFMVFMDFMALIVFGMLQAIKGRVVAKLRHTLILRAQKVYTHTHAHIHIVL